MAIGGVLPTEKGKLKMTKQVTDAYIVAAVRSPVGKAPRGVFRRTRPDDLLAHVLSGAVAAAGVDPQVIEDVIVGCAMPEGEQGMNIARIGLLLAGFPVTVPGVTINRFCSSGLQAVAMAADRIRSGSADIIMAAGTESMSMVPMMGNKVVMNPAVFDKDSNVAIAYGMGITAEKVASRWKISREAQDAFAYQSHMKALAGREQGHFGREILPYEVVAEGFDPVSRQLTRAVQRVDFDEGPRQDTTMESLASLRSVFDAKGTVTAGNSSQMSDGAAGILLASEAAIKRLGLKPLARFVSFDVVGVEPDIMGIGPRDAIPKALKSAGLKQDDLDWIELNEAFAAQSLAVIHDLGLNPAKINPLGGAIAWGHPLGATGAVRTATCLHGLARTGGRYGMVTMCVGTGMGAAGIFERV
jgi:acetyl-CoA acyltransferase